MKNFQKSWKPWVLLALLIAAPIVGTYLAVNAASLFGFNRVGEAGTVKINVVQGGTLANMTENYSASVYATTEQYKVIGNDSFSLYKSWIVGVNGSVADVNVKIGDPLGSKNITGFSVNFATNASGYGYFANFSVFITQNGFYDVEVWKDPDNFTASVYNSTGGTDISGQSSIRLDMLASNSSDAGYFPSWHPEEFNGTVSIFYINATFDAVVTRSCLNVTGVVLDPLDFVQSPPIPNFFSLGLSNGNKSASFGFLLVNGEHIYDLSIESVSANVVSMDFIYGNDVLHSLAF